MILITASYHSEQEKYVPGQILIHTPKAFVNLPQEVYGLFISYQNLTDSIQIEDVMYQLFRPGNRTIKQRIKIDYETFKEEFPEIENHIKISFSNEIIKLFKKYNVRYFERLNKTFTLRDTIPHFISGRGKRKLVKSDNENKTLIIYFDNQHDVKRVVEEFEKSNDISSAYPNTYITEYPKIYGPKLISAFPPNFPDSTMLSRINGLIIFRVTVSEDGNVSDLGEVRQIEESNPK